MLDHTTMVFIAIAVGYTLAVFSVFVGAWIVFRTTRSIGRDGLFSVREPKGDVFTVPDVDDASLFPEDEGSADEEHILKKTDEFLRTFEEK